VPLWAGAALLTVALATTVAFVAVRWQGEQSVRALEAAARAEASAQATVEAARPTAAPTAKPTADPSVPVLNVERVEPADSPASKEITAAARRYWEVYGDALYTLDTTFGARYTVEFDGDRVTRDLGPVGIRFSRAYPVQQVQTVLGGP
jgi:hypothetical protein